MRRKDRTTVWTEAKLSIIRDENQQPVGILGVTRDITERRRAEAALQRSETKFRTLYDSTSDAVMLLDEKNFFDCNEATLAIFGCATREEFCTETPRRFVTAATAVRHGFHGAGQPDDRGGEGKRQHSF